MVDSDRKRFRIPQHRHAERERKGRACLATEPRDIVGADDVHLVPKITIFLTVVDTADRSEMTDDIRPLNSALKPLSISDFDVLDVNIAN
jgi:hypothetical protein